MKSGDFRSTAIRLIHGGRVRWTEKYSNSVVRFGLCDEDAYFAIENMEFRFDPAWHPWYCNWVTAFVGRTNDALEVWVLAALGEDHLLLIDMRPLKDDS